MANEHGTIDALLPAEIAKKAEAVGAAKVRMDTTTLFVLALLGGAFIAFGAIFSTTVLAGSSGALPYGVARLLAGSVFCLGLILVVVGGAELFTGNALMVMAVAAREVSLTQLLRAWLIVYLGNLAGAVGTAVMVYLSNHAMGGKGAIAATALRIANDKCSLPFEQAFFLGVLCNVLVCLAVWLAMGAHSTTDKIMAVFFPIAAFVAAGFEHSVANMYFIPLGMLLKWGMNDAGWAMLNLAAADLPALGWGGFVANLIPVTLGNIVGGGVLVGGVYWFIYLRQKG